jgi:hypothetical protein
MLRADERFALKTHLFSGFRRAMLGATALCWLLLGATGNAAGPRWVTGPPYFTGQSGTPVVWYTTSPMYFTDPGNLSTYVNHVAADALVAAAAGVWNVPTAALVLGYGGPLSEHVSGADAYLTVNGPVFPADVQSGNYTAKQIAVIYDSDGSVTDMLLGGGASSPAECRQNGVTESADLFDPAGYIDHAVLVLNGRCTGPAPAQQLQMQYQLQRSFGRILGLAWSQTNDNVFTQNPQPTPVQAQHWPIMHPIDIVCGLYTYQCLPQPFTLRDDDVAAITSLYPMLRYYDTSTASAPAPGKVWSNLLATRIEGSVTFPTGQGMQGVNVVVQRVSSLNNYVEAFYDTSTVSGSLYRSDAGNPVTGPSTGIAGTQGSTDAQWEGYYNLAWIPNLEDPYEWWLPAFVTTEPINSLYTGSHAVGPYAAGGVTPSGASETGYVDLPFYAYWYPGSQGQLPFAPGDAANSCGTGSDGSESSPEPVPANGWWTGQLCGYGHVAWSSNAMRAGRTAAIEVTALDEQGFATTAKAMPLIGVWSATDPLGTLPTSAATPSPFNTTTLGMTSTRVATTQAQAFRFVVTDMRGDGRPDFAYQARLLYADTVQPALVSVNGGQITIHGMGFRPGNNVTVNGVTAQVSSWTATTIVAVAPPMSAFHASPTAAVDIAVIDISTGSNAVMSGALSYGNVAPDIMTLVSAATGTDAVGTVAPGPFAVRIFLGDGVTPVVGVPVTFSMNTGSVQFGACPASPCVVLTDSTGLASTLVTPTAFGTVTLQASAAGALQTDTFNAVTRSVTSVRPVEYIASGATVTWMPQAIVVQNGAPAPGQLVNWTGSIGMSVSPVQTPANSLGAAEGMAVSGPLGAGAQANGHACSWTVPSAVCADFAATGIDLADLRLVIVSGAGQTVALAGTFAPVVMEVTDLAGNPVAGAAVAIHQTATALGMPCPTHGPCPLAPVYARTETAAISDADGLFSVTPMQIPGVAEETNIAVATGTQVFISLSIEQGP